MAGVPARGAIHVGTSGWSYAHWKGPFYPAGLPGRDWLAWYAGRFRSVEVNNTFYHLPAARTVAQWAAATPDDFVFTIKASRYLTHLKKLRDPDEGLRAFYDRISGLGDKLGPVLFQLPPNWRCNPARLEAFLGSLDGRRRHAFEFRDPDWHNPAVYALLADHNAAFCIYELDGFTAPPEITADWVYLRLHGPGAAYRGSYSDAALAARADTLGDWAARGLSVYCYFDNDERGYAVRNAATLQAQVAQVGAERS